MTDPDDYDGPPLLIDQDGAPVTAGRATEHNEKHIVKVPITIITGESQRSRCDQFTFLRS